MKKSTIENLGSDKWVEIVMNSTNGMERAIPQNNILKKIELKLNNNKQYVASTYIIKWSVAAAVLLLFINFGSIVFSIKTHSKKIYLSGIAENYTAPEFQNITTYDY